MFDMRDWSDFDKFEEVDAKYLPPRGEGETVATQITTAVCKLVYKWYNDGDVFDNTHYLKGWCNDLSSFANWLYENVEEARPILCRIETITTYKEYSNMLYDLCEAVQTLEFLEKKEVPKVGSVYECEGPFKFIESYGEEEEEW